MHKVHLGQVYSGMFYKMTQIHFTLTFSEEKGDIVNLGTQKLKYQQKPCEMDGIITLPNNHESD